MILGFWIRSAKLSKILTFIYKIVIKYDTASFYNHG